MKTALGLIWDKETHMKTIMTAIALMASATMAGAYQSTQCYWLGSTYTCTTIGSGTYETTHCYVVNGTTYCTTY